MSGKQINPGPGPIRINWTFACSHDEVLANMGLTGQRFTVKHKDQVIEMTRAFLDYMKSLRLRAPEAVNPVPQTNVLAEPDAEPDLDIEEKSLDIKMTDDGYPILPKAIAKEELSKNDCERLIRAYLSQHYCKFLNVWIGPETD